jgi:hypothetical protein
MSDTPISTAALELLPRLATSRQWTTLPADFLKKVRAVFEGQFPIETDNGEFIVEGRIYPSEIIVRVGYLENGRLKQVNFEASMDLTEKPTMPSGEVEDPKEHAERESKTMENLYVCIDALGSLLEEYFEIGDDEEEGMDIDVHWRPFDFEGDTVYLQTSTVNTRLEEEADRILGLAEKRLFQEQAPSEDALANAEIDSDLAFEIQKVIRSGKYPREVDFEDDGNDFEQ